MKSTRSGYMLFSFMSVCTILLGTQNANAAVCTCDFSVIPDSTWTKGPTENTFDKVKIDTGVFCSRTVYQRGSSAGRISIFRRFIGVNGTETSESLSEMRVERVRSGTRCLAEIDNSGDFDPRHNMKLMQKLESKDVFEACVNVLQAQANRMNLTCEVTNR